jgi:hypothetical protein
MDEALQESKCGRGLTSARAEERERLQANRGAPFAV